MVECHRKDGQNTAKPKGVSLVVFNVDASSNALSCRTLARSDHKSSALRMTYMAFDDDRSRSNKYTDDSERVSQENYLRAEHDVEF